MILNQIQVPLVDISIRQFCAKGNIFKSGILILGILLMKQYTFSVFDFCKLFLQIKKMPNQWGWITFNISYPGV
jgi:hypothetical protein